MLRLADRLFGREIAIGSPIQVDQDAARRYFSAVEAHSATFMAELARRFDLRGKRVLSIGSGFGAEELHLSRLGAIVDCIEADPMSCAVAREMWAKSGEETLPRLFECATSAFSVPYRYDLIYTSSPSDWMSGDYRQAVPDDYLVWFDRFAGSPCILVAKLYGGMFSSTALGSSWLPKQLAQRFRNGGAFRLREYWLSERGSWATIVCTAGLDLLPPGDFSSASDRVGERSHLNGEWSRDAQVRPTLMERSLPYRWAAERLWAAAMRRTRG